MAGTQLTPIKTKNNQIVYTDLPADEVRAYLSGGTKTGSINGWEELSMTTSIYISTHAIVLVYRTPVMSQ